MLPVTANDCAGLPTAADVCESAGAPGVGSPAVGVDMVNGTLLDAPGPALAGSLYTETSAVPANAVSVGGIAAVSWVALTNVVGRAEPFHDTVEPGTAWPFTVEEFTKFAPFTVSMIPVGLQYGVEA